MCQWLTPQSCHNAGAQELLANHKLQYMITLLLIGSFAVVHSSMSRCVAMEATA